MLRFVQSPLRSGVRIKAGPLRRSISLTEASIARHLEPVLGITATLRPHGTSWCGRTEHKSRSVLERIRPPKGLTTELIALAHVGTTYYRAEPGTLAAFLIRNPGGTK